MAASNTELRQAADRLLDEGMGAIDRPLWVAKAVMGLARAWLAEHDETPVDEEWLLSVGFRQSGKDHVSIYDGAMSTCGTAFIARWDSRWVVCGLRFIEDHWKTRGDVRRLCAALGIPLTEGETT